MIPESEWKWFGHAQHLCVSERCRFRLGTQIGNKVVSTIGEWVPAEESKFTEIGWGRLYETMVFAVSGSHDCGCPQIVSHDSLEMAGYMTATEAQDGHLAMCRKVALEEAGQ